MSTAPHTQCQPEADALRQHTPTPWRVFTNPDGTKLVGIGAQDGEGILDCGFGVWAWDDPAGIANANLVVEAVNSHAALKSRVEELTKAREWQPIKTALKDGTWILTLSWPWSAIPTALHWDGCRWWDDADEDPKDTKIAEWQPSHWQPLPDVSALSLEGRGGAT